MWTYDITDLVTTTASGRLNSTRLLVGDTDPTDLLLQDAEINFALGQTGNNVYNAAAWGCKVLAAKFARMVDTQLDGALQVNYSDRSKQYTLQAQQLTELGKKAGGRALGVSAGGISKTAMDLADEDTNRVMPSFSIHQFDNLEAEDAV